VAAQHKIKTRAELLALLSILRERSRRNFSMRYFEPRVNELDREQADRATICERTDYALLNRVLEARKQYAQESDQQEGSANLDQLSIT
jgi:hypothetical protein